MDHQLQFLQNQISFVQKTRENKENNFEDLLKEIFGRQIPPARDTMTEDEFKEREAKIDQVLVIYANHLLQFDVGKDKLTEIYEERKGVIEDRYIEEMLELEMELENSVSRLMDAHVPPHSDDEDASGLLGWKGLPDLSKMSHAKSIMGLGPPLDKRIKPDLF